VPAVAVVFGAPDNATLVDWPDDDEAGVDAGVEALAVVTSSWQAVSARQAATIAIIANRGQTVRMFAFMGDDYKLRIASLQRVANCGLNSSGNETHDTYITRCESAAALIDDSYGMCCDS
jgi:hypothetical protein